MTDSDTDSLHHDEVKDIYERLDRMESRVDDVEDENETLSEENKQLREELNALKKHRERAKDRLSDLETAVDELESELGIVDEELTAIDSRADSINTAIDRLQEEFNDQTFHFEEKLQDIKQRLAGLENELGLEDWQQAMAMQNASDLERWAEIPEEERLERLPSQQATRATLVWEEFDEWSSPTHRGRVIRSGELKKLLSANLQTKVAYSQVYRVMESFDDHTSNQYKYLGRDQDKSKFGKALIRLREFEAEG